MENMDKFENAVHTTTRPRKSVTHLRFHNCNQSLGMHAMLEQVLDAEGDGEKRGNIMIRFLEINNIAAEVACSEDAALFAIMVSWATLYGRQLNVELCRMQIKQLRVIFSSADNIDIPHMSDQQEPTSDLLRTCDQQCSILHDIVASAKSKPAQGENGEFGNALCTIGVDLASKSQYAEAVSVFEQAVENLKQTHAKKLLGHLAQIPCSPGAQHVSEISQSIADALYQCGMACLHTKEVGKAAKCITNSSEYKLQAYKEFTETVKIFTVVVGVVDHCGDQHFSRKLLHLQSSLQRCIRSTATLQGVSANVGCLNGARVANVAHGQGRCIPFLLWTGKGAEVVPSPYDHLPDANVNPFVEDLVTWGVKIDIVFLYLSYGAAWITDVLLKKGVANTVVWITHKSSTHSCVAINACHDLDRLVQTMTNIITTTNSSKPGDNVRPSRINILGIIRQSFSAAQYTVQAESRRNAPPTLSMSQPMLAYNKGVDADNTIITSDPSVSLDFLGSTELECDIGHLTYANELVKLLDMSVHDPISTVIGVQAGTSWAAQELHVAQALQCVNGIIRHACLNASGISDVQFVASIDAQSASLLRNLTNLSKRKFGKGIVWLYNTNDTRLVQTVSCALDFCRKNIADTWVFVLATTVPEGVWNTTYRIPTLDSTTKQQHVKLPFLVATNEPINEVVNRSMLYELVRLTGFQNADTVDLDILRQTLLSGYDSKELGADFDWISALYIQDNDVIVNVSISGLKFLYGLCSRVVLTDHHDTSGSIDGFDLSRIRRQPGCTHVKLDTSHFAKLYSAILKLFDIPTHHQRMELERWTQIPSKERTVVHVSGPAGMCICHVMTSL